MKIIFITSFITNKILVIASMGLLISFNFFIGCDKDNNNDPFPIWLLQLLISQSQSCICEDNSLAGDPLFQNQWHLKNTGQSGGTPGKDVNVEPVWNMNINGEEIIIAIVDDGLDTAHEDLKNGINTNMNYNYLTGGSGITIGEHGTSVAGVIAARKNNGVGGKGVAPCACLVCYNLLQSSTSVNEYDAMVRNLNEIHISNNSWGPIDYTGQLTPAESNWQNGIIEGLERGRNGRGIIYFWAAGNGGRPSKSSNVEIDNSNYDGYANFYGVMAIGALGDNGERAYYSEKGANLWVCTYSNGGASGITTTDITGAEGYDTGNYTDSFGGTSSTAPIAAGVAGLMLNSNPNLSWRDIKIILAKTAKKTDPTDSDWSFNGAGYNINHKYGFGSIDAVAAVNMAGTWSNVGPQTTFTSAANTLNMAIPDNDSAGISDTITIQPGLNVTQIEFVSVDININHTYSGDLEIILTSPSNTESLLAEKHLCYNITGEPATQAQCSYFDGGATFTFGSARCLDESPVGNWTLNVKDLSAGDTGSLIKWSINLFGR